MFHYVKHTHNDKFRTYSIYCNNKPYLMPRGRFVLGLHEAKAIVKLLNTGTVRKWK